jgi:hypothetical protein
MSKAMRHGRQDRVATGAVDDLVAFSLQKIEMMAVEALKVQADMTDEKAPFEVSPVVTDKPTTPPCRLRSGRAPAPVRARSPWSWRSSSGTPLRRYEAVGAPSIVIIQAARADGDDGDPKFKVASVHLGGLWLKSADRRNVWDSEKQRLTAMHWLVAYGLGKVDSGRKSRAAAAVAAKAGNEVLWSMSSRMMGDMWLKPIRNPDVKLG